MKQALLATCWTHAGDAAPRPGQNLSPQPFEERVSAVAAAGFTGIGFLLEDLLAARNRLSYSGMKRILDDHRLPLMELEFVEHWWANDARAPAALRYRREILEAAHEFGVHHVKAAPSIDLGPGRQAEALDLAAWAESFHSLGMEAAAAGTRIALEFIPMSNIPDISTAMMLIEEAEHPALGLCVDVWHVERGPSTLDDVAALPPERIVAVELDDARREPVGTMYEDTVDHRLHCGTGDFDLPGFLRALLHTGFQGPWGVEILSGDHRARPLREAVLDAHRHADEALTAAVRDFSHWTGRTPS